MFINAEDNSGFDVNFDVDYPSQDGLVYWCITKKDESISEEECVNQNPDWRAPHSDTSGSGDYDLEGGEEYTVHVVIDSDGNGNDAKFIGDSDIDVDSTGFAAVEFHDFGEENPFNRTG